jgi:hypothetical protein
MFPDTKNKYFEAKFKITFKNFELFSFGLILGASRNFSGKMLMAILTYLSEILQIRDLHFSDALKFEREKLLMTSGWKKVEPAKN